MLKKLTISFVGAVCTAFFLAGGLPYFKHLNTVVAANTCIGNLRVIDGAKESWGFDHHITTNDVFTWADLVGKGRYVPHKLVCPDGGTYTIGRLHENPKCSIPGHNLQ